MCGFPIGRQQFRAGLHRPLPCYDVRNIKYTKVTYNNFNGGMFPMVGYGDFGYDNGLSKGEKWMLGLGGATSLLGAVLSAFGLKKDTPATGEHNENGLTESQQKMLDEAQGKIDELGNDLKKLEEENKGLRAQRNEIEALKNASKNYTAGAEQESSIKATTTYEVRGTQNGEKGTVNGDTGYNIVKGLYTTKDGKELTHNQILALAREIFKGKALKVGDIELPKEITTGDGTTYILSEQKTKDKEIMHKSVKQTTYQLGDIKNFYKGEATQIDGKWYPTVNGKKVDGNLYDTKEEAMKVAEAETKNRQKADQANIQQTEAGE